MCSVRTNCTIAKLAIQSIAWPNLLCKDHMVRVDYCHAWSRSLDKHTLLYPPGMGWRAGGCWGHLLPLEAINAKIKCNFFKLRFSDFIYFLLLGVIFYILFYINYKVPYYKGMVTKVSSSFFLLVIYAKPTTANINGLDIFELVEFFLWICKNYGLLGCLRSQKVITLWYT